MPALVLFFAYFFVAVGKGGAAGCDSGGFQASSNVDDATGCNVLVLLAQPVVAEYWSDQSMKKIVQTFPDEPQAEGENELDEERIVESDCRVC